MASIGPPCTVLRRSARSKTAPARALAVLLALSMFIPALLTIPPASAKNVTSFSDGRVDQVLDLDAPGKMVVKVSMQNDASVTKAGFDIEGSEMGPEQGFPTDVKVDVGDDGTYEWQFGGSGVGSFENQNVLSNGSSTASVQFKAPIGGTDTGMSLLLPDKATIKDANLMLSGNGSSLDPAKGPFLSGFSPYEYFGTSGANVGDVNNDGWDDLVIGSENGARAYLYHGGKAFDTSPDLTMTSTWGSYFGHAVTGLGDVNNDNIDDFAIAENETRIVRVYFGGPTLDAVADMNLTGETSSMYFFGYSLTGGSDLDGDGYPDIVIGDFYNESTWKGKAYVFKGGPSLDTTWDYRLEGMMGDTFGYSLATGGDVNDDGWDDLVVSAPDLWNWAGGAIYIYKGGPGFGGPPIATGWSSRMGDLFGYDLSIQDDINGDGVDDIMVGSPKNGSGYVDFFWGRSNWPLSPLVSWSVSGEKTGDDFGWSVSIIGDLDGDNMAEMIVGAPFYDASSTTNCGKGYFMNGSSSPTRIGSVEFQGGTSNIYDGWWVDGIGDVDDDGEVDLAISAILNNSNKGTVQIYHPAFGLLTPSLGIGGAMADPISAAPIINGTYPISIDTGDLQAALDLAPISFTDGSGTDFVELTITASADGPGSMTLHEISINYTIDTTVLMDLAEAFNTYLVTARGSSNPGEIVQIPIAVSSATRGRLVLGDLSVTYTPNQIPMAYIDGVDPRSMETANNVSLSGHGVDDGTIMAYNWSSNLEGNLGDNASIDVALSTIGTHNISLKVMDDLGIWSDPATVLVTVLARNDPPTVGIDTPLDGAEVSELIVISGSAMDMNQDPLRVEISIDNRVWEAAEGSTLWTFDWNSADVTDGPHTIRARAFDGALYSEIALVNVNVSHPSPSISIRAPDEIEALAGDIIKLNFTLENTGTGPGNFSVKASSSQLLELATQTVELEMGETKDLVVKVFLDKFIKAPAQIMVQLSATQNDRPWVNTTTIALIKVVPKPANPDDQSVYLEAPPNKKGKAGQTLSYDFVIRNTGTVSDTYEFQVSSSLGWDMRVRVQGHEQKDPVDVKAGSRVDIEIFLDIPADVAPGSVNRITVSVGSLNFPQVQGSKDVEARVQGRPPTTGVISIPWTPVATSVIVMVSLGVLIGATEWGKYGLFWMMIPLYSRLKKEAVLDNFKRGEINAFIKLNPGTYYNEIKKYLGVSNGVLTYHLNKLEQEGYVRSKVNGRYKHYFSASIRIPKRIVILNELQRGLIRFISDGDGVTQSQISKQLDMPIPSVSRHLKRLMEADLIKVERRSTLNFYMATSAEDPLDDPYFEYNEDTFTRTPPGPPEP